MDRGHTVLVVLLNLLSIQLTFCVSGDNLFYLTPASMHSRASQPIIQAQFHPASGTIQQGIMLPPDHTIPIGRNTEELYYQRLLPEENMFEQRRIVPLQQFVPLDSSESQEQMTSQDSTISEQHVPPPKTMLQGSTKHSINTTSLPQTKMASSQQQTEHTQIDSNPHERMAASENIQKLFHTSAPHAHTSKHEEQSNIKEEEVHSNKRMEDVTRAVKNGYEYPHPPYPQSSYGYTPPRPNYSAPASPAPYTPPAAPYTPPQDHSESPKDILKPDLSELIKPVTGKIASKLNGLFGLLSLLGSGKGLELGGLTNLLFEGILKPFLAFKGGLKALISKLAIPVIALILINAEVLVTVWWMWEDCPEAKPAEYSKPSYSTPSYNYR